MEFGRLEVWTFATAGALALTLVTPTGGLTPTGSDSTPYPFLSMRTTFCGLKFMNPHTYTPSD